MHLRTTLPALLAGALVLAGWAAGVPAQKLDELNTPPGIQVSVFARVPNARSLAVLPSGRVVVAGSREGAIHAAVDTDGDRTADRVVRLASGLSGPHGVAWHDGRLYVSEQHRVWRIRVSENDLLRPLDLDEAEVINDSLPDERHHGTRDLAFGPDGRLYVALGSPCNVCRPEPPADGILSMRPDGSDVRVFARGVRNSVGLAFHPESGELFFTDNGADWMGDNSPPDELNHAPRAGLHFGFPWYGGGRDRTGDFRGEAPPQEVTFPVVEFAAHVAALGIHFYTGAMLPAEYRGDAFVAQHGSWNRSTPIGYRVMRVRFEGGQPTEAEVFIDGWQEGASGWGRPVDAAELPDGSLLVSDDAGGLIYRVSHSGG